MSDTNCGNCRHASSTSDTGGNYLCRRYPPTAHPLLAMIQFGGQRIQLRDAPVNEQGLMPRNAGSISLWPLVRPEETCGEHSPKLDA